MYRGFCRAQHLSVHSGEYLQCSISQKGPQANCRTSSAHHLKLSVTKWIVQRQLSCTTSYMGDVTVEKSQGGA